MPRNIYDKPSEVVASGGFVLVDGPGPFTVAFTPEAALMTAARLEQSASDAKVQSSQDGDEGPFEGGLD